MSTIQKEQFVERMQNKTIDIHSLPPALQKALKAKGADISGDGKISGKAELEKCFEVLDSFDKNGDPDSIRLRAGKKSTNVGRLYAAIQQHAQFKDDVGDRVTAKEHMKTISSLPTQHDKIEHLAKAYHLTYEAAEKVVRWTQLDPHPSNPENPGDFIQAMNHAAKGTLRLQTRELVGSIQQNEHRIELRLSDGTTLSLNKYERLMLDQQRTKHFTTTLVDSQGNAKLSGGLTPDIDQKIRHFQKNVDDAIRQQEDIVANASGSERKLAHSNLLELRALKSFGVRVFLNMECRNRNIDTCRDTDRVLDDYRFGSPSTDLTQTQHMLDLMRAARSYAISNVVGSKEAYRGMRGY